MSSARTEARQATQRAVLSAADQLFQERRFSDTTVRDIARKAGVSVGTVMAGGDKETLLVKMFDSLIEEYHRDAEATSPVVHTCCSEAAVVVVKPFVELFGRYRDLAQVYASILVGGKHSSVVFTDLAERLVNAFEQAIAGCECSSFPMRKPVPKPCMPPTSAAYLCARQKMMIPPLSY